MNNEISGIRPMLTQTIFILFILLVFKKIILTVSGCMGTGVELTSCVLLVLKKCQSEDFGLGMLSPSLQCFCVMYTHVQ